MFFVFSIKFLSLYRILESKLSKSETTFISVHGDERRTRPLPPSQTNPKPYTMAQYPPLQLSDYRTHKPYRERKFNNNPLPVIAHNHSDRKPRPALYEPRYRAEKHHPFTSTKPSSLVTIFHSLCCFFL